MNQIVEEDEITVTVGYGDIQVQLKTLEDVEAMIRLVRKDAVSVGFPTPAQVETLALLGATRTVFERKDGDMSPIMEVLQMLGAEATQVIDEDAGTTTVTRIIPDDSDPDELCGCCQCGSEQSQDEERPAGGVLRMVVNAVLPETEGDLLVELAENVQGKYYILPEVGMSDAVVSSAPVFSAVADNFIEFVKASSVIGLSDSVILVEIAEFPDQLPDGEYVYKLTLSFGPMP